MAAIQVVNYPVPNGTSATAPDERLTVSSTVVTLAAFAANTQFVVWDVQNADVMVTFDGSDPTTTNGHRLYAGKDGTWHVNTAQKARFIRASGSDAAVQVSQFNY
jgi:hypothetical protein